MLRGRAIKCIEPANREWRPAAKGRGKSEWGDMKEEGIRKEGEEIGGGGGKRKIGRGREESGRRMREG